MATNDSATYLRKKYIHFKCKVRNINDITYREKDEENILP